MADFSYALTLYAMEREEERPVWLSHLRPDLQQLFHKSRKALLSLGVGKIIERTGPIGPYVYPVTPTPPEPTEEVDLADEFTEEDFLNSESAYSSANPYRAPLWEVIVERGIVLLVIFGAIVLIIHFCKLLFQ